MRDPNRFLYASVVIVTIFASAACQSEVSSPNGAVEVTEPDAKFALILPSDTGLLLASEASTRALPHLFQATDVAAVVDSQGQVILSEVNRERGLLEVSPSLGRAEKIEATGLPIPFGEDIVMSLPRNEEAHEFALIRSGSVVSRSEPAGRSTILTGVSDSGEVFAYDLEEGKALQWTPGEAKLTPVEHVPSGFWVTDRRGSLTTYVGALSPGVGAVIDRSGNVLFSLPDRTGVAWFVSDSRLLVSEVGGALSVYELPGTDVTPRSFTGLGAENNLLARSGEHILVSAKFEGKGGDQESGYFVCSARDLSCDWGGDYQQGLVFYGTSAAWQLRMNAVLEGGIFE